MNKVTVDSIKEKIRQVTYVRVPGTTTTICHLTLENGFVIVGTSACVDPKNFDAEIGNKLAYEDAFRQIWRLEGYLLAERIHEQRNAQPERKEQW